MTASARRRVLLGAAIACAATALASTVILPVPLKWQETEFWCWDACTQAVLEYYGDVWSQYDIAWYATYGGQSTLYSGNCLCQDCSMRGVITCLQDLSGLRGGVHMQGTCFAGVLSLSQMDAEMVAGRPVPIQWAWNTGGGHIVVARGIDGYFIHLMNPSAGYGYTVNTYDWTRNDGRHNWEHTIQLTTKPGWCQLTSPANGATYTAPASIPITASVRPIPWRPTTQVALFANGNVVAWGTAYVWPNVPPGSYDIQAIAFDTVPGSLLSSAHAHVTVVYPPLVPPTVSASDGTYSNRIRVAWNAQYGASGYEVWRNTANNSGTATMIAGNAQGTAYNDYDVLPDRPVYYWVKTIRGGVRSAFSTVNSGWRNWSSSYALTPVSRVHGAGASTGTITVTQLSGVAEQWSALKWADWISIQSGSPDTGNGLVTYTVASNAGAARIGLVKVTTNLFSVYQAAAEGLGVRTNWFWREVKKLTPSNNNDRALFGSSVSVAGDVILVGAELDDAVVGTGWQEGSAYVFHRDAGGAGNWGQVKKLVASDGGYHDLFGWSVSVCGNVAAVGAPNEGEVYIYGRDVGGTDNWGEAKRIPAGDGMGNSVLAAADEVVAGVPGKDAEGITNRGAVYVCRRQGEDWVESKWLTASDGAVWDALGWSVGGAGDRIVAGACYDDGPGGGDQGSAYLYERHAGGVSNWGQVRKLVASDGAAGDYFGLSVSLCGDVVVVGADEHDAEGMANRGAAYVYQKDAGGADNWGEVRKLVASDGAVGDALGSSVSAGGDWIVVGANQKDIDGRADQGAAYVYGRDVGGAGNWGQAARLTASDGAANDNFGWSVAVSGNVIVVGALQDDDSRGSAYVHEYGYWATTTGSRRALCDYDGDGRAETAAWWPASGQWFLPYSGGGSVTVPWGGGDTIPAVEDYNGDGIADPAVFRPASATWYVTRSGASPATKVYGSATSIPVPADYNGDGRADVAVFEPAAGQWWISFGGGGSTMFVWGVSGNIPVPADYNGDRRDDAAVFVPVEGKWYIRYSGGGSAVRPWGAAGDVPVPADYDGDGRADVGIFRKSSGRWYVALSGGGQWTPAWGSASMIPVPADYDGDGRADAAVYQPSDGKWYILYNGGGSATRSWGSPEMRPTLSQYWINRRTGLLP